MHKSAALAPIFSGHGLQFTEMTKFTQHRHCALLTILFSTLHFTFQVNLLYGIHHPMSRIVNEKDTCTACGGTMIMEFAALSRLTGNSIYEVILGSICSICVCK